MSKVSIVNRRSWPSTHDVFSWVAKVIVILQVLSWITTYTSSWGWQPRFNGIDHYFSHPYACRPLLPPRREIVSPTNPVFRTPSSSLDRYLRSRVLRPDIDSLAIAVVTPSGNVFQKGYGVLKANETEPFKKGKVDGNSIYRIASITKMFNVLETLILRDRGALNWDDPITKIFPNFTYNQRSWPEYLSSQNNSLLSRRNEPITVRQLASHMSGIARDYPPPLGDSVSSNPSDRLAYIHMPQPGQVLTRKEVFEALSDHPLITPPYSYPVYSNTGFDLLGWVNVEANAVAGERSKEPETFADLIKRDIFRPIGMNSSSFAITPEMRKHLAVAARDNWDADLDFTDTFNPSGGQYSSLLDISTFMQTLLDPSKENSVLSPYTVREWLRPLHGWNDDLTEVGAPWEITKFVDSVGRRQRFYQKGGNLMSYHSHFGINPASSYGVVVLVTGSYANTARLAYEAIRRFQPVFDELQRRDARDAYAGRWTATENGIENHATISTRGGSLWVDQLVLNGTDILALLQGRKDGKARPFALWNTGPEEFRVAIGRPGLNDDPLAGCEPYWVSMDGSNIKGVPIDLLYFDRTVKDGETILKIPGVEVSMTRVSRN